MSSDFPDVWIDLHIPVVTNIVSGLSHSCALFGAVSTLSCWGGFNDHDQHFDENHTVQTDHVLGLSVGDEFTCVYTLDQDNFNDLYTILSCRGYNELGQTDVPRGTRNNMILPDSLTSGALHSCVINTSKAVRCWGSNLRAQLEVPQVAQDALNVFSLSAGASTTCAIFILALPP